MWVCVSHDELHPWVVRGVDKIGGRDTVLRMGSLEQADCSLSPEKKARGPRMEPPGRKVRATGSKFEVKATFCCPVWPPWGCLLSAP